MTIEALFQMASLRKEIKMFSKPNLREINGTIMVRDPVTEHQNQYNDRE